MKLQLSYKAGSALAYIIQKPDGPYVLIGWHDDVEGYLMTVIEPEDNVSLDIIRFVEGNYCS